MTKPPLPKKARACFREAEGLLLPTGLVATFCKHRQAASSLAHLEEMERLQPNPFAGERLQALKEALASTRARARYVEQYGAAGVRRFRAGGRLWLYGMEIETFPQHVNNVYVISDGAGYVLFDVGSGLPRSCNDLELAMAVIREVFEEPVAFASIHTVVISHAHIDHFGGVHHLRANSKAAVAIHDLDVSVLTDFEARLSRVLVGVERFLVRAGVEDDERGGLLSLYLASRKFFHSTTVERALHDGDRIGKHRVIHTPGHCPGQICLRVGEVLLTSDHILARITPHQFPEAITPFGGLGHYFASLDKVTRLAGIAFGLGGHEEPIDNVRVRIEAIRAFHATRLDQIEELCQRPKTIRELSEALFGAQQGYGAILAIEEVGAHVEHLLREGRIAGAALEAGAAEDFEPIRYRASAR